MSPHICPWWAAYGLDNPLRRLVQKPELILSPYVKAGMRCLDLGCGPGFFSLAMARLAGPSGKVVSVDLQSQMLKRLKMQAAKAGLEGLIQTRQCGEGDLGVSDLNGGMDFALAFYMVHEVPDPERFLNQAGQTLKPQACFMIVEPVMHVTKAGFGRILDAAAETGLTIMDRPKLKLSRTAVLRRV